jgi:hypothetical protein
MARTLAERARAARVREARRDAPRGQLALWMLICEHWVPLQGPLPTVVVGDFAEAAELHAERKRAFSVRHSMAQ